MYSYTHLFKTRGLPVLKTIRSLFPGNVINGYWSLFEETRKRNRDTRLSMERMIWGGRMKMILMCLLATGVSKGADTLYGLGMTYLMTTPTGITGWTSGILTVFSLLTQLIRVLLFLFLFGVPVRRFLNSPEFQRNISSIPDAYRLVYLPILWGLFKRQLLLTFAAHALFYISMGPSWSQSIFDNLKNLLPDHWFDVPATIVLALAVYVFFQLCWGVFAYVGATVLTLPYIVGVPLSRLFLIYIGYLIISAIYQFIFSWIILTYTLQTMNQYYFLNNIVYLLTSGIFYGYVFGLLLNYFTEKLREVVLLGGEKHP